MWLALIRTEVAWRRAALAALVVAACVGWGGAAWADGAGLGEAVAAGFGRGAAVARSAGAAVGGGAAPVAPLVDAAPMQAGEALPGAAAGCGGRVVAAATQAAGVGLCARAALPLLVYETLSRPAPTRSDPSSAAEVVGAEALARETQTSLMERLARRTASLYVTSRGTTLHGIGQGSSGGFSVRGLGGAPNVQVLVLVDDVPDLAGIFGHPLPDVYVPALVDHVEVIPGGDSVAFGSNAMGGVVRITSAWGQERGEEVTLHAGFGSFETYLIEPVFQGRYDGWDVAAAAHLRHSDGHRDGMAGDLQSGQVAARVRLAEGHELTVRTRLSRLRGADPGPATHPRLGETFSALRHGLSVSLRNAWPAWEGRSMVYVNWGRHAFHDGFRSLDALAGAKSEWTWQALPSLDLSQGVEVEGLVAEAKNEVTQVAYGIPTEAGVALFQSATFRPWSPLTLVAGWRVLVHDRDGWVGLFKVGGALTLWSGAELRSRVARNYRRPTLRERWLPFPVANPELRPETSLTTELTLAQRLGQDLEVRVTGYHTLARDMIKTFGIFPAAQTVNIDEAPIWGVEGGLRARIGPYFSLEVSGAWQDVGRYTRQNPSHRVTGSAVFSHAGLTLALSGEWVGGLHMANYGRDPMADVAQLDLHAAYAGFELPIEVYVDARNLTHADNAYVKGYPMPGFSLFGGLRARVW